MSLEKPPGLERHIQTVIVSAIFAVMSWVALTMTDLRDRVKGLEVQYLNLAQRDRALDDLAHRVRDLELAQAAASRGVPR